MIKIKAFFRRKKWILIFLAASITAIALVLGVWQAIKLYKVSDNQSEGNRSTEVVQQETKKQQEEEVKKKEASVTEVAPVYCKNHKSFTLVKIDKLITEGFPMYNGTGEFDDESCKKIIEKLYDIDPNKEHLMMVAKKKYWIGMDYRLLIFSIGTPNDINSSTNLWGTSQQLIYGNLLYGATYVYLDNGIVTSYQNW